MKNASSKYGDPSLRLLASALLLASGLVVYWLFRPEIILFQLLQIHNPDPVAVSGAFESILKNYYADTVWGLAIVMIVSVLRDYRVPRAYRQALLLLPFVSEAMQAAGVIPGVFDWVDLTLYFCILTPTLAKELKPMNKTEKNIAGSLSIAFFTFALLATSATTPEPPNYVTGTFTLPDQENDIFTKTALIESLRISEDPSIVLRVPNPGDKVTEEQKQADSVLYNLIEKEFAKSGFVVRDRQLFDKVLEQETSDYSKIGRITETDYILELLRYDLQRKIRTDLYVDDDGQSMTAPYKLSFNSAIAEFKLISVKKNDLVGSYTFYYTPCTDGCRQRFDANARRWNVNNSVPSDFFESAAREMVKEMGLLR